MRITLEFNSVEELHSFYEGIKLEPQNKPRKAKEVPQDAPAATPAPKREEPASEVDTKEDAPGLPEVRKLLLAANKAAGEKIAKEWIKAEGYDSLAHIDNPEVLKRLADKAKEVIGSAE